MKITTEHPRSSYGIPVILDDSGEPIDYAPGIKAIRARLGFSTAQLGEAVGKSRRTVEDYEQGRRGVPAEVLNVLAGMLPTGRRRSGAKGGRRQ